jgi:putative ABC transport system substrate-binding protein
VRRRQFIVMSAGALLWPVAPQAQTKARKPARIATIPDLVPPVRDWFIAAMLDHGWRNDHDFTLVHSAVQPGQINVDEAIARTIASNPDLIFAGSVSYALPAHRFTTTIPIVMWISGYPVEAGLAESLARPGKNVTGNAAYAGTGIWGKLLELLREAKPGIARVGVLWTYSPPAFPKQEVEPAIADLKEAAQALGLKAHIAEAATPDQLPLALAEFDAHGDEALLLTSNLPSPVRAIIMQFATSKRLPTISDLRWRVGSEVLPLISYAPDLREMVKSAAVSVVKVLQGEGVGDIPIQRPTRFETILNLKTANALGLTVPSILLSRADEVIE